MGKATIAGGGEEGQYTITLDYGSAVQAQRVALLNARIAELSAELGAASSAYDAQQAVVNAAIVALNEAIHAYAAAPQADPDPETHKDELDAYKAAAATVRTEQGTAYGLKIKRDELSAELATTSSEANTWGGLQLQVTQSAWCADFTEDATGEVATIDIPGESTLIVVAPGGAPPTASDGQLVAREVQSPEQVFFNAAILPGIQRFKPTYRVGTVTSVDTDADTASVSLDAAYSSAQNLPINSSSSLSAVPVEYMTCNAAIFETGDRVIVKFEGQDWSAPKVIGFVSNPKPCWPEEFYANLAAPVEFLTDGEYFYLCWPKTGDELVTPCSYLEHNWAGAPESRVKVAIDSVVLKDEPNFPNIVIDPDAERVLYAKTSLDEEGTFINLDSNVNDEFFRIVYLRKNKGGAGMFILESSYGGPGICNTITEVAGYHSDASFTITTENFTTPGPLFEWLGGEGLPPVNLKNTETERTKAYYPVEGRKSGGNWQIIYRREDLVE